MEQDNRVEKAGKLKPSAALRPPPLFRSIGLSGLSASLPPHRRLRSVFCRSRAVLPVHTHTTGAAETHNHVHKPPSAPLGLDDVLSADAQINPALNAQQTGANSDLHSHAVLKAGLHTDTLSLIAASPLALSKQEDSQLCSPLSPPAVTHCKNRGRSVRVVSPLQTSEHSGSGSLKEMREKQQGKRKKRSRKVGCKGKNALPSLSEKGGDDGLCAWLQSLGIADNEKDSISENKHSRQQLFVSRCRRTASHREAYSEAVASRRRDRRPHFLPPICQSGSLLHVPLLLPKNSPPPSPCRSPHPPFHPLPVPLLQPLSLKRK